MPMSYIDPAYLEPTAIIDSDHPRIVDHARQTAEGARNQLEQAVKIYFAVRDGIRYNPYTPFYLPNTTGPATSWPGDRLLRLQGLPALCPGPGPGDPEPGRVRHGSQPPGHPPVAEYLGSDLFVYHGYTDFTWRGNGSRPRRPSTRPSAIATGWRRWI